MHFYIYGPPGSGKTILGNALARRIDLPFYDLDSLIEARAGKTIPEIFAQQGEVVFRGIELDTLREVAGRAPGVIALGGGALLDPQARTVVETSGRVLCLNAAYDTLLARVRAERDGRPLLSGDPATRLRTLLDARRDHYSSFHCQLDTTILTPDAMVWQAQRVLGAFRVRGMGQAYDVRIDPGGLDRLGIYLKERGLDGSVALVSDSNVGRLYLERVEQSVRAAGYSVSSFCFAPGEKNKTIQTVLSVWNFFIESGIERGSTLIALGGGIVGDLTGFAAATFLRGVNWVNLPTSLLAMVDSSLGGKTGIDLPQAKNLVGAFHSPRLVLADPQVLDTLPERELRSGMAEALKHGLISDPVLFNLGGQGWQAIKANWTGFVTQAMAVKLQVIEQDPYEKNLRQALNLGHTIGHGVELASHFQFSHGEAVAIGMVAEARLAERIGLAEAGLANRIASVLAGFGLPVDVPGDIAAERIVQAMQLDKKRAAGKIRFALPVRIGDVRVGIVVDDWQTILEQDILRQKGER